MKDKEFFEIRGNSNAQNNGLYQVDDATPLATTVDVRKVSGADPVVEAVGESNDILCSLDTAISDGDWNNASGETAHASRSAITPQLRITAATRSCRR
jgi:hypothetical protein